MNLSVGIVGLPNVGKSTLFNALLKKQQALAANYPFATIEPNVGIVGVPDERLEKLAEIVANEIASPAERDRNDDSGQARMTPPIVPATVEFVDIAGLVRGASEGAGLGNKFLSHIREVQVIVHVVRDFEDQDVIRHESTIVDPRLQSPNAPADGGQAKSDYETIRTELILADLQTLGNVNEKSLKLDHHKKSAVEKLNAALDRGASAFQVNLNDEEKAAIKELGLLSAKPEIIVLNVSEGDYSTEKIHKTIDQYTSILDIDEINFVVISAQIESELASLTEDEQREYLKELGLEKSGLERLIQKAYQKLGLISFLTAGEKEVRAWTIRRGSTAVEAAGVIHTDFMQKFIKAEIVSYEDFVNPPAGGGGWKNARENGRARMEGRDYIMAEGDVVEFKIGR